MGEGDSIGLTVWRLCMDYRAIQGQGALSKGYWHYQGEGLGEPVGPYQST